jgi:hypothetical protein
MSKETESTTEQAKKQKKRLSPERERAIEEAYEKDKQKDEEILNVFEYLEVDAECPNAGTKARQSLMKKAVVLMQSWKTGTYREWLYRLSLKLNLNPRNVRESYLSPLIAEGIIDENNGQLRFVGIPKESKRSD